MINDITSLSSQIKYPLILLSLKSGDKIKKNVNK